MLFEYIKQAQRFLHDGNTRLINPEDLISYANRARREVAMRTQSIRVLPPISGSVVSATITAGGSGYTNPSVAVSPPDFPSGRAPYPSGAQATATIKQTGGQITDIEITYGGFGYFQPTITITDPTGSGAAATANLSWINQTVTNQEAYQFSNIDTSSFPGVGPVFAVQSVSMIYANYRYSLPYYSFSTYQAAIRQYPFQYVYVPTMYTQRGQGTDGSLYLYPLPSQNYQMDWDCFCLPQDLTTDQSVEALPQPWTDAVPYFMAYLAYAELQNLNSAQYFLKQYDEFARRYSQYTRLGRANNPYGRF